jgi:hypothetical protein
VLLESIIPESPFAFHNAHCYLGRIPSQCPTFRRRATQSPSHTQFAVQTTLPHRHGRFLRLPCSLLLVSGSVVPMPTLPLLRMGGQGDSCVAVRLNDLKASPVESPPGLYRSTYPRVVLSININSESPEPFKWRCLFRVLRSLCQPSVLGNSTGDFLYLTRPKVSVPVARDVFLVDVEVDLPQPGSKVLDVFLGHVDEIGRRERKARRAGRDPPRR